MRRTLAAWLVALPAAAGGVLAAHAAAYALLGRPLGEEHGYLPLAQALVCALLAVGFAAATACARSGRLRAPGPAVFTLAPPVAFLLQETAERGFVLPLEPVVLLGLVLQLPLALLAFLVSRALLRAAEALGGRRATSPGAPSRPAVPSAARSPRPADRLAARGRAPPVLAAS